MKSDEQSKESVEGLQEEWRKSKGDLVCFWKILFDVWWPKMGNWGEQKNLILKALAVVRLPARKPDTGEFWAESIVSGRDKQGYVQLRWQEQVWQLSIADARQFASQIQGACEAAESDAFLVDFFTKKLGLDESQYASLLLEFRRFREKDVQ